MKTKHFPPFKAFRHFKAMIFIYTSYIIYLYISVTNSPKNNQPPGFVKKHRSGTHRKHQPRLGGPTSGIPTTQSSTSREGSPRQSRSCDFVAATGGAFRKKILENGGPLPSLKLTAKAPENWWLEDDPFGARPIFRGELLVLGRVLSMKNPGCLVRHPYIGF